jgi:hypothetical protein
MIAWTDADLARCAQRLAAGASQRTLAGELGVAPATLARRLKAYRQRVGEAAWPAHAPVVTREQPCTDCRQPTVFRLAAETVGAPTTTAYLCARCLAQRVARVRQERPEEETT